jgi:glycosyltransferase involved in cell wall biosynthesis
MFHRIFFLITYLVSLTSIVQANSPKTALVPPVQFFVVIPSYNNEKWCIKNLESVVKQTYPFISILYIDDCSTDATGKLVDDYIIKNGLQERCRAIHNKVRKGAMANIYTGVSICDPHKVVAIIDGDDRLIDDKVFEKIAKIYADKNVWCTYGNFITEPFTIKSTCKEYPPEVQKNVTFRSQPIWMGCQLRTFYAKLFHLIKKEDFLWQGNFMPMTSDIAFMMPIFELSAHGHIHFVKEPNYVVNTANPISDLKKNKYLQLAVDYYIRSITPYTPLETLF